MGRLVRCVLQGIFSADWLSLTVVEVARWINMQPTSGLIVLIALNLPSLALPFVPCCFVGHGCFDRRVVPGIHFCFVSDDFGKRNHRLRRRFTTSVVLRVLS